MTQDAFQGAQSGGLPPAVQALAEADFSAVARLFADAGFAVLLPAPGMLQVKHASADLHRPSVAVSVGVHGDETGPIEVLAYLLDALSRDASALAVDLLVCVGNVDAIRAGKRFIDADLNRMFRPVRGALASAAEAARADDMIAATSAFFNGAGPVRWHLDLHTAIRPSVYPTFAIVPDLVADVAKAQLIDWLGQAAIGAIIMNPQSAGTYSYYSAEHFGAAASTVELGRVGTLGQNDLSLFDEVSRSLDGLLRGAPAQPIKAAAHVFKVAQEIIKHSDDFRMAFDRSTQNFTALPQHALIATDGDVRYTVQHAQELVVFPNPDVRVGLRAGLMVVRVS
ncbi:MULTISPECIES: succinylglutamate desuccinylase [unclassified Janthinobacterium]|uniref:succinylglutamate desuccinylase n=1 Tax=unclassified Janthinobacterium TaxID=2610881 RepID=UPI0016129D56|nr:MULTISPECIES: succinylglutamate desuccinylase [unclassified Janthinobacterium]MBB5608495.1 succinylglutamate desuccinylase [Janthinobacterium sp. S3T4]MBB5614016.1 succinylglutamate desuccinylase [Janthinobacterium sp. S3M3]